MYAIIETGGKQYSVSEGEQVRVEKLDGEVGSTIEFDRVVAVATEDGKLLSGREAASVKVTATIADQGRGKKIRILKFKRRKMYRRHAGHRQDFTAVKIDKIAV